MDENLRKGQIQLFLEDIIEKIRKRYSIPKKYKAFYIEDYFLMQKIMKLKYNQRNFEIILEGEKETKIDGFIKYKDFYIVTFNIMGEGTEYIIFAKNHKSIMEEFYADKIRIVDDGLYKLKQSPFGSTKLELVDIDNVAVPILNNNLFQNIEKEMNEFIAKRDFYEKHKLDYKRGILLYGLPGNGKTCFIKYFLHNKKAISIIIDARSDYDLMFVEKFIRNENFKNRLKIIVMEDIDGIASNNRSVFLNMLDGIVPVYKTIFIATTNFPKNLDVGLLNRPSRFDSFYQIDNPIEKSREKLLKSFFPKLDGKTLAQAVKNSKDFRASHFKEIFIISSFYNCDVLKAINILKEKFKDFAKFDTKEGAEVG